MHPFPTYTPTPLSLEPSATIAEPEPIQPQASPEILPTIVLVLQPTITPSLEPAASEASGRALLTKLP